MTTDIHAASFFIRHAPKSLRPYLLLMRVDRPVGIWLLLIPGLWGLTLGMHNTIAWGFVCLFLLGSFLMRSAGCLYNDWVDQDLDRKVSRTKNRPLAAGTVSSRQAFFLFFILLGFSLGILLLFNMATILLGIAAFVLVLVYPWMKRLTHWPQLFLSIVFNWGVLMGETCIKGKPSLTGFFLMMVGFLWTFIYDTLYAHQDLTDDLLAGVKSSAIALKGKTKPVLLLCVMGQAILLMCMGWKNHYGMGYYVFAFMAVCCLSYLIGKTDLHSSQSCLNSFKKSQIFGWLVLGALLMAHQ